MEIPQTLINQIQSGQVTLFLGSGSSAEAKHPLSKRIPLGNNLSDDLAKNFLTEDYIGYPLINVSELAISQTDLYTVQNYIRGIFEPFIPNDFHKQIPEFVWKAIFTTNYDLIIERAYKSHATPIQDLTPIVKNTRENEIFKYLNSLPYYKLHGCIDNVNDDRIPLILTAEQYISHRDNRENLFSTLKEIASSNPVVFVGYSMNDINIRTILSEISHNLQTRPRFYIVLPSMRELERKLWEEKRITPLIGTFKDFLEELDKRIPKEKRVLATLQIKHSNPIVSRFQQNSFNNQPSENFYLYLNQEVDYVYNSMPSENVVPREFYKGYFENWEPILRNLDVKRTITDDIISEVFIDKEYQDNERQYIFLIKGYAGCGKSVLLKRLAYDASSITNKLCLFLKSTSKLSFDFIQELYFFCKERIFLFVDGVSGRENDILQFINACKNDKIPVSIIVTERTSIWNTDCLDIHKILTSDFELKYLDIKEIQGLIHLLDRHDSLGELKYKTTEERIKVFENIANRVLLVALYEATNGKPFADIIADEYKQISLPKAQSMYLTVCIFHRLGSAARAGLIARVHGINFEDFKRDFFKPLEFIVFDKFDYRISDYVYYTRHKQIADIVFETILINEQDRYDEFIRLIEDLNTDFDNDRKAFLSLTNAKKLMSLFSDPQKIRSIYAKAGDKRATDEFLMQQEAIFEMEHAGGSFFKAEKLLNEAYRLNSTNPIISHSFAELELLKAQSVTYHVEKNNHLHRCIEICKGLISKPKSASVHSYHTLIKAKISILETILKEVDPYSFERALKDVEKSLVDAKSLFPEDEFILNSEANLNELLENTPQAKEILTKAFNKNPSPFITIRLANLYKSEGNIQAAIDIIKQSLDGQNQNDKELNLQLGILLSEQKDVSHDTLIHIFKRAFTKGDTRHFAQFWYARSLYLNGLLKEAKEIFDSISNMSVSPLVKNKVRGVVKVNNKVQRFKGVIKNKNYNYGFIKRDIISDDIFFYQIQNEDKWDLLTRNHPVSFEVGFTYKGPIANNIKLEV